MHGGDQGQEGQADKAPPNDQAFSIETIGNLSLCDGDNHGGGNSVQCTNQGKVRDTICPNVTQGYHRVGKKPGADEFPPPLSVGDPAENGHEKGTGDRESGEDYS